MPNYTFVCHLLVTVSYIILEITKQHEAMLRENI